MANHQRSDIFIYNLGKEGYWAFPSPFVAHGAGTTIHFRNLTDDDIEIDLSGSPLGPQKLALAPRASGPRSAGSVDVQPNAAAGLYLYKAVATEATSGLKASRATKKPKRFRVKGGSSPKIIIDT